MLQGHDTDLLLDQIKSIIIKTVISIYPHLSRNQKLFQQNIAKSNRFFQLLGFDILIDSQLKPWLLEVNQSPSFATDSPFDYQIKHDLIKDVFTLLNLSSTRFNKLKKIQRKKRISPRYANQFNEEKIQNLGNFESLISSDNTQEYQKFIEHSKDIFDIKYFGKINPQRLNIGPHNINQDNSEVITFRGLPSINTSAIQKSNNTSLISQKKVSNRQPQSVHKQKRQENYKDTNEMKLQVKQVAQINYFIEQSNQTTKYKPRSNVEQSQKETQKPLTKFRLIQRQQSSKSNLNSDESNLNQIQNLIENQGSHKSKNKLSFISVQSFDNNRGFIQNLYNISDTIQNTINKNQQKHSNFRSRFKSILLPNYFQLSRNQGPISQVSYDQQNFLQRFCPIMINQIPTSQKQNN